MEINNFKKNLICWGGSDQCRVIKPIIDTLGAKIDVIIDDTANLPSPFPEIPIMYGKLGLSQWLKGRNTNSIGFIIAIGNNPYGFIRGQLHEYLVNLGLTAVSFCDPSSIIDSDVIIGGGAQIMRGVIVNTSVKIGKQCILNTKCLVEHHCEIGDCVEIAPAAVLTGRVKIKNFSWICTGAIIMPRVTIGSNTVIGAGAVVTADIEDEAIAIGIPAKKRITKL